MHTIQIKYTMHKYTDTDCGLSGSCLHATLPGLNQPRPLATFFGSYFYIYARIFSRIFARIKPTPPPCHFHSISIRLFLFIFKAE